VASVTEEQGSARDLSLDAAILERVIDVLGGQATVASVAAGAGLSLAMAADMRIAARSWVTVSWVATASQIGVESSTRARSRIAPVAPASFPGTSPATAACASCAEVSRSQLGSVGVGATKPSATTGDLQRRGSLVLGRQVAEVPCP